MKTNWKAPHWRMFSRAIPCAFGAQTLGRKLCRNPRMRSRAFGTFGGKLLVQYTHNAVTRTEIFRAGRQAEGGGIVPLPRLGSVGGNQRETGTASEVFFSFRSFGFRRR